MRTSIIGGDAAHRGLLGGRVSTARIVALSTAIIGGLALVLVIQIWGVLVMAGAVGVAWLLTIPTSNNTILGRALKRSRWKQRVRLGTTRFVPFTDDGWAALAERCATATGRNAKRAASLDMHAMRETPDGVEGMLWLQDGRRVPGIQWHQPDITGDYLAVTFGTTGQVQGIETDEVFDVASAGFERVCADLGQQMSLARRIQPITRAMPTDSARHEGWMAEHGDPSVAVVLQHSYKDVIDGVASGQLMQRSFMTVSWPIGDRFLERASRRGAGADGWLALMRSEIDGMARSFTTAGFRNVRALTARETAALIRHMQHPAFPMDQVADVTPTTGWLPSEDSWSYTTYVGAPGGALSQSVARTCRITAPGVDVIERNALWMAPLLGGMHSQVVRTIAWHIDCFPQEEARFLAEKDRVSDIADQSKRAKDGALEDIGLEVEALAAARRHQDLTPGTGHAGANWVGYITVSAGTSWDLLDSCDFLEEAASNAGIRSLKWLDVDPATAHTYTWPVGRGIIPGKASMASRVEQFAHGKEAKQSL